MLPNWTRPPARRILAKFPNITRTIKACRTRELSAEQKFTRDHWRKQNPPRVRQNFERFLARVTKNSQISPHTGRTCLRQ